MRMMFRVCHLLKRIMSQFPRVRPFWHHRTFFIYSSHYLVTSQETCPKWAYSSGQNLVDAWGAVYLPPIQKRINSILRPIQLTTGDVRLSMFLIDNDRLMCLSSQVHGALYACAYELAAFGNTTWCDVFTRSEILNFEYECVSSYRLAQMMLTVP